MTEVTLKGLKCQRCGYVWRPNGRRKPKHCASKTCNSPYWSTPRRQKRKK